MLKATAPIGPTRETLVGSVERVTFHNEENGFAVLKVRRAEDAISWLLSATRLRSPAGEFIHAVGVWFTDRTHGLQFKADLLKTTPPTTTEGIEKYLGSGMTRGIGPKLAKRIVGVFGEATFEIIEASPEKLREVPGIGEFRAGKIAAGWAEQKAVRDIKGIGFRTADAIAMKIDMTREAPQRVRAGISFALQETTDEGHCALPVETLVELAIKLLDIDKTLVGSALDHELAQGEVVAEASARGHAYFCAASFSPNGASPSGYSLSRGPLRHGRRSTLKRRSLGSRERPERHSPPPSARRSGWYWEPRSRCSPEGPGPARRRCSMLSGASSRLRP